MAEIKITDGFIVSCMECHQQIGTPVDTHKAAVKMAKSHLTGGGDKNHTRHTVAITPTEFVRLKL